MTVDALPYKRVIFAAMSKKTFYMREHIVKFILEQKCTPTCAFMMYSYFLLDTVSREALIAANNRLVEISDELWVFGPVSDGCQAEINLSRKLGKPVKFFNIKHPDCIFSEISETEAEVE